MIGSRMREKKERRVKSKKDRRKGLIAATLCPVSVGADMKVESMKAYSGATMTPASQVSICRSWERIRAMRYLCIGAICDRA
jgi:hypothetical protein